MPSSGRRRPAMVRVLSSQPAMRLIIHTDAEDDVPAAAVPVDEDEVVEPPPQYHILQSFWVSHVVPRKCTNECRIGTN